jgi:hypothetical protein
LILLAMGVLGFARPGGGGDGELGWEVDCEASADGGFSDSGRTGNEDQEPRFGHERKPHSKGI